MLTDQEFQRHAERALEALYSRLAQAVDRFDFDVDSNGGTVTVEFEEPRERFVVSPNAPVRQIWVSAHVQSFKLDWVAERDAFVYAPTSETLDELIATAIRKRIADFAY